MAFLLSTMEPLWVCVVLERGLHPPVPFVPPPTHTHLCNADLTEAMGYRSPWYEGLPGVPR